MKKIIAFTLASSILLTGNTFAGEDVKVLNLTSPSVAVVSTPSGEETLTTKYDIIIRNNIITADYEYNNVHYYTKKITTKDIVIPEEIKKQAKKIYFLVEEGQSMTYLKAEMLSSDAVQVDPVTKEYNYKIVPFVESKEEYTFNSADLVKDFSKNQYKNVTIHLVADLGDDKKIYLANGAYVGISDKAGVLESLKNTQDTSKTTYYGYYDNASLETYLEKLSEKLSRADYKKMLTTSQSKLKTLISKNESDKKELIDAIKNESDFAGSVEKYALQTETNTLLSSVLSATQQQFQKIRSYDLIDSIFGK